MPDLVKSNGLRGIYNSTLLWLFKRAFKNAKAITSTSRGQANKIKELFQIGDVEPIRTGVDVAKIAGSRDSSLLNPMLEKENFIFSPRFMSPIYNIEVQIGRDPIPAERSPQ